MISKSKKEILLISNKLARRIAINSQLLHGYFKPSKGKEGAAQIIEKLGYIQLDSLTVIQRAQHLTLKSRQSDYKPRYLDNLLRERRVFEYWGHAMSYLPMSDYRFYIRRMRNLNDPYTKWEKQRLAKYGSITKYVKNYIKAEGPCKFSDIDLKNKIKNWGPDIRNPIKSAMELLHLHGELMVADRDNFQRVYDLTERILPSAIDTSVPTDDEIGFFLIRRAVEAYGIATEKEIKNHIHAADGKIISKSLKKLCDKDEIVPVQIEGNSKLKYYTQNETISNLSQFNKDDNKLNLLSPFDNLIIQRDRVKNIFGFDYMLECYVPAPKRKYGYYVIPILWGDNFVGRFDPKADRKRKTLIINKLIFEKGFKPSNEFIIGFAGALKVFAEFNECESIEIENSTLPALVKKLMKEIQF